MAVVVDDPLPWSAIDHRLTSVEAGPFLSLACSDGQGTELDSLDGPPGPVRPLGDLDPVETHPFESF